MVSHLMGDDVGLGKIPGNAEAFVQFFEEAEIEINLLVTGAIKRSNGRLRHSTSGFDGAGKENQLGWNIGLSGTIKGFGPDIFSFSQYNGNEPAHIIILGGADVLLRGHRRRFPLGNILQ